MDKTFIMIKPDAVRRRLIGELISRIERKNLTIANMKMVTIPRVQAEEHYGEHSAKPFFGELVDFITSGPVVMMEIHGNRAVEVMRTLMGATDPASAAPGTIRGDYSVEITENLMHGSDSSLTAERELALFFG